MTLEEKTISAIRGLVIDMTNKAKSGHPGMALDAAPALYALWHDHYKADAKKAPNAKARDRFVLSSGHVSALLYAFLFLDGVLSKEDIESFRQLGSKTPGHPEYGYTDGVDATAGPLGQGIAQAVGMAIAEKKLSYIDKSEHHYTYCLCGDGCLEEGISQEAISLAGLQELNRLILLYDANESTLDGPTSNSMREDVKMRFLSSGWDVIEIANGEDWKAISAALVRAKESEKKPVLIYFHTKIGYGSPLEGSHKAHGNPLGEEMGEITKKRFGISWEAFSVPADCLKEWREAREKLTASLAKEEQEEEKITALITKSIAAIDEVAFKEKESTRSTSGRILQAIVATSPYFLGGAADVAGSVMTALPGDPSFFPKTLNGKNMDYGIREFAMAAINNGILLHKGLKTYGGCFLVFSDYMKNAIRMSALEHLPAIYLFSHDSIAVGEDGPTHQPVEQLVALRSIPHLVTLRPADAKEMKAAWKMALESKDHPVALILSRQNLPLLASSSEEGTRNGAYVIAKDENPEIEIIASGSEVSLALEVKKILNEKGISLMVVSMPSMELFRNKEKQYQEEVLPLPYEKRYSLEMLSPLLWHEWAKHTIGMEGFGASGKESDVEAHFGFTKEEVAKKILSTLEK